MIAAMYCVAAAMILGGAYAALTGWEFVIIERGWTQVLVGSMTAVGGVLLAGLTVLVGAVRRVERRLAESPAAPRLQPQLREPSMAAPPAVPQARSSTDDDAGMRASAIAGSAAGVLAVAALAPKIGSPPSADDAPSADPARPDAKPDEAGAELAVDTEKSGEIPADAAIVDASETLIEVQKDASTQAGEPQEPDASSEPAISAENEEHAGEPVPSPVAGAPKPDRDEESFGESEGPAAPDATEDDGVAPDVPSTDGPADAPFPSSLTLAEERGPDGAVAERSPDDERTSDVENDGSKAASDRDASAPVFEPEFGAGVEGFALSDGDRDEAEQTDEPADLLVATQDAAEDEALSDDAVEDDLPMDGVPDDDAPEDEAPMPVAPRSEADRDAEASTGHAPDQTSAPPPSVIGTYESGANVYTMYSDGSIDALTPDGEFHFASLDELKIFIAEGGEERGA